jgi:hypothetical protein
MSQRASGFYTLRFSHIEQRPESPAYCGKRSEPVPEVRGDAFALTAADVAILISVIQQEFQYTEDL